MAGGGACWWCWRGKVGTEIETEIEIGIEIGVEIEIEMLTRVETEMVRRR